MRKRRDYQLLGRGAGMTFQEIADELKITVAGAMYIYNRAMSKLQRRRYTPDILRMKQEASGMAEREAGIWQ